MTIKNVASARLASALSIIVLLVSGCATPPPSEAPAPAPAPAPPPASVQVPAAPPPLVALPFADAVARAGERLLQEAQASLGNGPRELAIDPFIDASTGQQTNGTVQMGAQLAGLVTRRMPTWNVQPLTRGALVNRPLLLIGTLTPINSRNAKDENADAFAICLALADLRTGKVVTGRLDRAQLAGVDAEPIALFREAPTWALDATAEAYIETCYGTGAGDPIVPAYLQRLPAAAAVNDAMIVFADNKPADAYRLYREARTLAGADDLRVLNGLYTTSWKTGRKKEAAETFARIVAIGLDGRKLPIKLFFNPGTTTLLQSADQQAQYALWLNEAAAQIGARTSCVRVVGHTTRTGSAAANDVLSQKRAAVIKQGLERQNRKIAARIAAEGVGSREVIVGLGTDDVRDALDRGIELRTVDCR